MSQPPDTTDRRFATTLARGLMVLRAFRASDDGLGNAEIAERTGIPKSTVSRLTFTLQTLGYLTHARRHDRYRPGPALLALGNVAQASISFVDLAGPIMQRLADETGTLSLLLVRDEIKLLIVKTCAPGGCPRCGWRSATASRCTAPHPVTPCLPPCRTSCSSARWPTRRATAG